MKKRLDVILVEKGLCQSRERAQALILSGDVLVSDVPVTKAGTAIQENATIRLRKEDHPYVSRGALKLVKALDHFKIPQTERICLDVGASTGGFTEVLLLRGATKVIALDVGHNQLDWKIRTHPKVVVIEKMNARNLKWEDLRQKFDTIVIDVSFISLDKILPALTQFCHPLTDIVALIKPQFEAGRDQIGKGGIVTDLSVRDEAVNKITEVARDLGFARADLVESPITGIDGNVEFLAHFRPEAGASFLSAHGSADNGL